jgi:hypothetical protein
VQSAPFGGKEVPKFMNEYAEAEEKDHEQCGSDHAQNILYIHN